MAYDIFQWREIAGPFSRIPVTLCCDLRRTRGRVWGDAAARVGITERPAQRIVADLIEEGYLESSRVGRRNQYRVNTTLPMRHPIEEHSQVVALQALILPAKTRRKSS